MSHIGKCFRKLLRKQFLKCHSTVNKALVLQVFHIRYWTNASMSKSFVVNVLYFKRFIFSDSFLVDSCDIVWCGNELYVTLHTFWKVSLYICGGYRKVLENGTMLRAEICIIDITSGFLYSVWNWARSVTPFGSYQKKNFQNVTLQSV